MNMNVISQIIMIEGGTRRRVKQRIGQRIGQQAVVTNNQNIIDIADEEGTIMICTIEIT